MLRLERRAAKEVEDRELISRDAIAAKTRMYRSAK